MGALPALSRDWVVSAKRSQQTNVWNGVSSWPLMAVDGKIGREADRRDGLVAADVARFGIGGASPTRMTLYLASFGHRQELRELRMDQRSIAGSGGGEATWAANRGRCCPRTALTAAGDALRCNGRRRRAGDRREQSGAQAMAIREWWAQLTRLFGTRSRREQERRMRVQEQAGAHSAAEEISRREERRLSGMTAEDREWEQASLQRDRESHERSPRTERPEGHR